MDRVAPSRLLHADFDVQARLTPDAIALHCAGASITFAELQQRATRVACALGRRGVGNGAYVGMHVDRSIDYVASVLGVLKAGAAVVPLPPAYPRARLVEILEFARLDAVLDHPDSPLAPVPGTQAFSCTDFAEEAVEDSLLPTVGPHQPAFVLASSGSTGKPKLIVRSHRSFYHRLCWTWAHHPYGPEDRCVQKSTMTTTHAIYELFEPLLQGVPTLVLSDAETRDLQGFWQTINAWSTTRLLVVPSALQVSMEFPGFAVPSIKVVVLMGEYVHQKLAARAIEVFPPHTFLYSIYGSTEASSTLVCDLRESYRPNQELPLGRPISSDVQALVLGEDRKPVGAGTTGVLHISGAALFTEYFRDPELTHSVFVQPSGASDRLYDTHDQVRLTSDGNLEYVGRTDHIVKIRGFRVDIQEVERTLLLQPGISHAAVVRNAGDAGDAALIGFYAPGNIEAATVQGFMRERLPPYMIPSALVAQDALPRTASGKTDRRKLLEEYVSRVRSGASTVALSPTESRLWDIWHAVLKHGDLHGDSSFFEVGGTSLTSFAVMHRVREAFCIDRTRLADDAIYRHPTLRGLAAHVDQLLGGGTVEVRGPNGILVTLRRGSDPQLPPVFLIASAGGTLGAYEKLAKALETKRDIIGVRDPYLWGERDPSLGFRHWISLYLEAMRKRQPEGPYCVVAYSSAGAPGYEIARRLRADGQEVELLAIIDPFGIDRQSRDGFGMRVMQSRFRRAHFRWAVLLRGWLRERVMRLRGSPPDDSGAVELPLSDEQFRQRVRQSMRSTGDVGGFSALLALNSGLPLTVTGELARVAPDDYFPFFLERVRKVAPELDTDAMTRIFEQYFGLQVPAQQAYPLRRYDGDLLLVEVDDASRGLVAAQFRPHVRKLNLRRIAVPDPPPGVDQAVLRGLSYGLRKHYVCMRDDQFVTGLAQTLAAALRT